MILTNLYFFFYQNALKYFDQMLLKIPCKHRTVFLKVTFFLYKMKVLIKVLTLKMPP